MSKPKARTFFSLMDEVAAHHPDRPFVTDRNSTLSYAEFRGKVIELAKGFQALGLRRGDKIGILMGNQNEWLIAHFAATALGATTVALNTWWRSSELRYAMSLTDVSILVMVDRYLNNDYISILQEIGDLKDAFPALRHTLCLSGKLFEDSLDFETLRELGANAPDEAVLLAADQVNPDDVAYLLFTSGSTGHPKAVQLTHRGCIENCYETGERMHLTPSDRVLMLTSLFWSFSCVNCLFATLTHGASLVLQFRFDAGEALGLIESERCTAVYTQPNMVIALCEHPDARTADLSSWRTGMARTGVLHLLADLGVSNLITGYGLTECYGNSVNSDAGDTLAARMRNAGRPLPNVELEIVSPTSKEVRPRGETGEIRLRGHVTPGYYKDSERTAAAIDKDGWFYTGDIGVIEEDGTVTFKGRIGEMIKTGGINVTPGEVEATLLSHKMVVQAVVMGVPDKVRDEIVAAMVVLGSGESVSEKELVAYCSRVAAAYKVPRFLTIVKPEEIPLTSTGKIHKGRVQEILAAQYRSSMAAAG